MDKKKITFTFRLLLSHNVRFTRDTNCDNLTKEQVQMGYNSAMF